MLRKKIESLIAALNQGLHERDEIIAVSLLSALAGQNTFLFGPPGTAKSLISKRIACAFNNAEYFECLMNRFSTPEEMFGPVSLKALKEDRYERKTKGYLATADFAFLDEIWKSSPAILNTLLTLINEHTFKNGDKIEKAPLKGLIAASNEIPDENTGLDALFDRFTLRLLVAPMQNNDNFEQLLNSKPLSEKIKIDSKHQIDTTSWQTWQSQIHEVRLSEETLTIIKLIRTALAETQDDKENAIKMYVSDRRWQRAITLIKASAFFYDRKITNHTDTLLLRHCLWTTEQNCETIMGIVENAVKECGFEAGVSIAELDREKEQLESEIKKELYISTDVYETTELNDKDYFLAKIPFKDIYHCKNTTISFYIPADKLKSSDKFCGVDENGNEYKNRTCCFNKQGSCTINFYHNHHNYNKLFTPKILFHKGDKKSNVSTRIIKSLNKSVTALQKTLEETLALIDDKKITQELDLHTAFVPKHIQTIATKGMQQQVDNLALRVKDCERLASLCQ